VLALFNLVVAFVGNVDGASAIDTWYHPYLSFGLTFFEIVISLVVGVIITAALLGVLKAAPFEGSMWPIIKRSIKTYTGVLVRLSIILMLVGVIVTIPLSTFMAYWIADSHHMAMRIAIMIITIFQLVLIKFALANPLVVVEGKSALGAIAGSWRMTSGRFLYVLGCYLFLGTGDYLISEVFEWLGPGIFHVIDIVAALVGGLWFCLWELTGWCMYWRIKAKIEEQPEIVAVTPALN
jgi:hypothetical protein